MTNDELRMTNYLSLTERSRGSCKSAVCRELSTNVLKCFIKDDSRSIIVVVQAKTINHLSVLEQ